VAASADQLPEGQERVGGKSGLSKGGNAVRSQKWEPVEEGVGRVLLMGFWLMAHDDSSIGYSTATAPLPEIVPEPSDAVRYSLPGPSSVRIGGEWTSTVRIETAESSVEGRVDDLSRMKRDRAAGRGTQDPE